MLEISWMKISQLLGGLASSYIIYKTIRIYLIRRKYRHIPGPPTKGFTNFFIFSLEFTTPNNYILKSILEFFLGNISDPTEYIKNGKSTLDWMVDLYSKFVVTNYYFTL
jgi:hypothetical protein